MFYCEGIVGFRSLSVWCVHQNSRSYHIKWSLNTSFNIGGNCNDHFPFSMNISSRKPHRFIDHIQKLALRCIGWYAFDTTITGRMMTHIILKLKHWEEVIGEGHISCQVCVKAICPQQCIGQCQQALVLRSQRACWPNLRPMLIIGAVTTLANSFFSRAHRECISPFLLLWEGWQCLIQL